MRGELIATKEIDMYASVVKQTIEVLTEDGKAVLEGGLFFLINN